MISVILNVYKRPYTLETQIKAVLSTGLVLAKDIHVWVNTPEGSESYETIKIIQNFGEGSRYHYYVQHLT